METIPGSPRDLFVTVPLGGFMPPMASAPVHAGDLLKLINVDSLYVKDIMEHEPIGKLVTDKSGEGSQSGSGSFQFSHPFPEKMSEGNTTKDNLEKFLNSVSSGHKGSVVVVDSAGGDISEVSVTNIQLSKQTADDNAGVLKTVVDVGESNIESNPQLLTYNCPECKIDEMEGDLSKHLRSKGHIQMWENQGKLPTGTFDKYEYVIHCMPAKSASSFLKALKELEFSHIPGYERVDVKDRVTVEINPDFIELSDIGHEGKSSEGYEEGISKGNNSEHICAICQKAFKTVEDMKVGFVVILSLSMFFSSPV